MVKEETSKLPIKGLKSYFSYDNSQVSSDQNNGSATNLFLNSITSQASLPLASDSNEDDEITQTNDPKERSLIQYSLEGHCINYEDRCFANVFSDENVNFSFIVGYGCIAIGVILFITTFFSLFLAPFLQPTTHKFLEFLRTDSYYCLLIPLSTPVTALIIYLNWLAIKYFKHT